MRNATHLLCCLALILTTGALASGCDVTAGADDGDGGA